MSLVSEQELLLALKVRTPAADVRARYDLLREWAEQAVKEYCKWGIEEVADQIDFYDGNGYRDIPLRRPFVSEIDTVWFDQTGFYGQGQNAFASGSELTAGQQYALVLDSNIGSTAISKSGLLRRLWTAGFWFPSDLIYYGRAGGLSHQQPAYWPVGYGNIKVKYTYGFAVIPESIKLAVTTAVGTIIGSVKYGYPLSSESLGAHSVSMAISREPEFGTVRQLLGRYRDISI